MSNVNGHIIFRFRKKNDEGVEVINNVKIFPRDLIFDTAGGEERKMGPERCYSLSYCNDEDEIEMECIISEYPVGTLNSEPEWEIICGDVEIIEDTIDYRGFLFSETEDDGQYD